MLKKLWSEYRVYFIAFVAITALVLTMWIFNIPCPIKHITGISCAGCGMSRAVLSALSLDFAAAFAYHPLWIIVLPSIVAIVIIGAKGKRRAATISLICLAALFLAVWMVRLIAKDSVVAFDTENSVISKLINIIFGK